MNWAIVGALGMSVVSGAWGSTLIVDNTGEVSAGPVLLNSTLWTAQAFKSDSEYTLDSVQVIVGGAWGDLSGFTASLYAADSSGAITGAPIDTFVIPDLSGATGLRTFDSQGHVALHAGQTYFFSLGNSVDNDGDLSWYYTASSASQGAGSIPAAMTYANWDNPAQTWTYGDGYPQFLAVSGTLVPEPASMTLALGAAGCLLGRRRRSP